LSQAIASGVKFAEELSQKSEPEITAAQNKISL